MLKREHPRVTALLWRNCIYCIFGTCMCASVYVYVRETRHFAWRQRKFWVLPIYAKHRLAQAFLFFFFCGGYTSTHQHPRVQWHVQALTSVRHARQARVCQYFTPIYIHIYILFLLIFVATNFSFLFIFYTLHLLSANQLFLSVEKNSLVIHFSI